MKIPKIIHFVWAGRNRLLPDLSIATVLKWHIRNPSFEIYLWVNHRTAPAYMDEYYPARFRKVAEYLSLDDKLNLEKIAIKDIETEDVSSPIVRYEIDRLRPNYGASGDALRILIVHRYGGAYFDSDVLPSSISLETSEVFESDEAAHRLFVHCNSQGTGFIGNDAFFSTVENPHLHLMYQFLVENYRRTADVYSLYDPVLEREAESLTPVINPMIRQLYSYDNFKDGEYIEKVTPNKTGGGPLRSVIPESKVDDIIFRNLSPYIDEAPNHRAWINQGLIGSPSVEKLLERIISTIRFEAEELGMLRLDDHIDNLASLTGYTLNTAGQILTDILAREAINYSALRGIQIKLTNQHSLAFYLRHNFPLFLSFWLPHHSEKSDCDRVNFIEVMLGEMCESYNKPDLRSKCAYFFSFLLHRYADFIASHSPFLEEKKNEVYDCLIAIRVKLNLLILSESFPVLKRLCDLLLECVQYDRAQAHLCCFHTNPYDFLLDAVRESTVEWQPDYALGKEVVPATTLNFCDIGLRDVDILSVVRSRWFADLTCLDLTSNNLSDDCVPALIDLPVVKDLRLGRNNFRSAVALLFSLPGMERLDLTDNPLDESTVNAIRTESRLVIRYTPRLFGNIERSTPHQWEGPISKMEQTVLVASTVPAATSGIA